MTPQPLPTVDENPERCETCRHFFDAQDPVAMESTDELWGYCWRYPPTFVPDSALMSYDCESWQRPTVLFSDRCGEWRGK